METFRNDLRLAFRVLLKNPGFTAIAALTLALGIAVNATMFSLVSGFLLQRPPGRDPERIVVVSAVNPNQVFQADASPVSAPNFLAWREANHVFADTAAADDFRTVSLTALGQPESLRASAISPNYFSVLGVSPQFGRVFSDGEDKSGRDHVVILTHALWERQFASDPSIIGRTVRLNRENYSVIGVMPANFRLLGPTPQLWIPLTLIASDQTAAARKDRSLLLYARLKPAVTLAQARAELATLAHHAEESFPDTEKGWGASVRTMSDFFIYSFNIRTALVVLMTTVGFVLLIACANVTGLLLARAASRKKELALRIALGAGRMRIARQLLTEGLLIALLGGAAGLLFSVWGIHFLRASLSMNEFMLAIPISLDWNVVLFALGASLLCALLCALAPALNASRTDINTSLKDEGRAASSSRAHSRLRTLMVTGEIAFALFLLIGAGLLIRSIFIIQHQNLGFRPDPLLTADVTLDSARYKDSAQQTLFVQNLLPRLQQIPGAESAAVASDLPATGPDRVGLQIQGQPDLPADKKLRARHVVITPDYFRTAGVPLLHGRAFADTDNSTAPRVVLVNQEFVHRFLHDAEPLGQQIRLDISGATPSATEWSEIVGVVTNVKPYSEETRDDSEIYESFPQRPMSSFSLMVRASSDPNGLAPALRGAVSQVDAELPLAHVMSMPDLIVHQRGGDGVFMRLMGTFASLALILAAVGIYGLVAYSVNQRTHEIGIRMALGAGSPNVLRMILWEGLKMASIGAAIGLVMALPLPKVFNSIFQGLEANEPRLYAIVPLVLLLVAMLATYVPARRATEVDPMRALRQD